MSEAPSINRASKFAWRAFCELQSERVTGMDQGAIPFRAIIAYADEFSLKGRERENLQRVIRAVDSTYLSLIAEKRKRSDEKAKSKSGGGPGNVIDTW